MNATLWSIKYAQNEFDAVLDYVNKTVRDFKTGIFAKSPTYFFIDEDHDEYICPKNYPCVDKQRSVSNLEYNKSGPRIVMYPHYAYEDNNRNVIKLTFGYKTFPWTLCVKYIF